MTVRYTKHTFIITRLIIVQLKLEMLKKLKDKMQPNDILKTKKLEIQFCNNLTDAKPASSTFLPVVVHRCPENFNTVEYFEVHANFIIYTLRFLKSKILYYS